MEFTFDPAKDEINKVKHGMSLAEAASIEWETAVTWPDVRKNYGEDRSAGIGYIGQRLHYVVFLSRDDTRRIISLRKANQREAKRYAEA